MAGITSSTSSLLQCCAAREDFRDTSGVRLEEIMQTISLDRALAMIPYGASLMIGGFMSVGAPGRIVDEIVRQVDEISS
jgi:hypothetical protein